MVTVATSLITPEEEIALEKLIDARGLANVLYAIDSICEQKRDHIETSYGDANLAQHWHNAGYRVRQCADSKRVQYVTSDEYRAHT